MVLRAFRSRSRAAVLLGGLTLLAWLGLAGGPRPAAGQVDATPPIDPCAGTAMPSIAGTPGAMAGMDMAMGSPMAGMATEPAFDQLYIDMMLPHHGSIVATSEAALTRLQDERLRGIARRIIDTQRAEQEELRGYRDRFYGSPEPMGMDGAMMGMMQHAMPGVASSGDAMARQMDPTSQVAAFCAAGDPDLAFIDLTIPHHLSAVTASETALDRATHAEVRAFAARVIEDQRREIDELSAIRAEKSGAATPQPLP